MSLNNDPLVSVVIHGDRSQEDLPRLFNSILAQDIGPDKIEIVLDPPPNSQADSLARRWKSILGCTNFKLVPPHGVAPVGQSLNMAMSLTTAPVVAMVSGETRLDPRFLSMSLEVLDHRKDLDLVYPDYISSGLIRPGMVRLPRFNHNLLRTQNIIGPLMVMRRRVWSESNGFVTNTAYENWDFWIKAALDDHKFFHIPTPLGSCRTRKKCHDPKSDGRAKAMLIVNNPAYFDSSVMRWAMGLLRSELWATSFKPGIIPRPIDVQLLMEHFIRLSKKIRKDRTPRLSDVRGRLSLSRRLFGLAQ